MTAFLKLDHCRACGRDFPWEWVPPILVCAKPLAGTGVWRSSLIDGLCESCARAVDARRQRERRTHALREQFIRLLGGVKPYRDFTFERFRITSGNRTAVQLARQFDATKENIYLWGPHRVGKTHLAIAILRQWFPRCTSIE